MTEPPLLRGHEGRRHVRAEEPAAYTIEAWHEKLGTQTQSVTLGEKESKGITFTFKSPAASTN